MADKSRTHLPIVNVITLGCPKNLVDSEKLMGKLKVSGINVSHGFSRNSDILIINTCGFIQDAKEESIEAILQAVQQKKNGKVARVVVMGCLSERYMAELKVEIPEVDHFYGVNDLEKILEDLNVSARHELYNERMLTTPPHYAYLKIAEGCDRTCSFCAIPLIRGKNISLPLENLLEETRALAAKGVKELILVAQDLTWYGLDLYKKRMLAALLEKLVEIDGIEWIRLHYAYPAAFPMDVLDVMAAQPKICKYLDIPFQHISSDLLASMRRGINKEETYRLIDVIRRKVPGITLRTSLMVGYPGETQEHFEELKEFIGTVRFERMGVFTYSEEEGTRAASLADEIPKSVKDERAAELMELQQQISEELNLAKVGKTLKTIIEGKEGDYYVGRTEYDSPGIDNEVLIPVAEKSLKTGEFYNIRILKADAFDVYGSVID
ncbi:MAG: 30S ribosomal protein S12 methylthiotransferase RimO [Bacteroidales bacterium]|nr:30S ribosomal protein S12 methylthiotransferase RimO [Bacteroidales bacterium]